MREQYPKAQERAAARLALASTNLVLAALVLAALVLGGCARDGRVVRDADPAAPALDDERSLGRDGPFGVRLVPRAVRVRVDERIDVDVLVPLEADGAVARARPVAVLVHGGLVAPARYEWLAIHLASRGFVVLVPSHALDLAFFEQENALEALRALRRSARTPGDALHGAMDDAPAAILGHSLGGVVASSLWDEHPDDLDELVLFASYPAGSTLRPRTRGRALSILGGADARVSRAQASDGLRALATSGRPAVLAVIDGMSHLQIADDVSPSEASSAGVPTIDEATARAHLRWLVDAMLWPRTGGTPDAIDDPSRWPEGVERGAP
jgi:dienelactone hydrolase